MIQGLLFGLLLAAAGAPGAVGENAAGLETPKVPQGMKTAHVERELQDVQNPKPWPKWKKQQPVPKWKKQQPLPKWKKKNPAPLPKWKKRPPPPAPVGEFPDATSNNPQMTNPQVERPPSPPRMSFGGGEYAAALQYCTSEIIKSSDWTYSPESIVLCCGLCRGQGAVEKCCTGAWKFPKRFGPPCM